MRENIGIRVASIPARSHAPFAKLELLTADHP